MPMCARPSIGTGVYFACWVAMDFLAELFFNARFVCGFPLLSTRSRRTRVNILHAILAAGFPVSALLTRTPSMHSEKLNDA